jgi:HlyD family secretion protein
MSVQKFPARGSLILGFGMLVLLVGGFGAWSFGTTLSGAVIAPGQIEVESHRQIVQHLDGGVVAEIRVVEGARVAAGEVLMRLDGTLLSSELAIVESQLYEVLARRGRLEAERDDTATPVFRPDLQAAAATNPDVAELMEGQARLFDARRTTVARQTEQLERRADQTQSQIGGIDAQTVALQSQLALIRQELETVQGLLEKGLAEASRLLGLQREEARLMGQVGELIASRASSEGRITEVELEVLRLAAARREEASTQLRDIGAQELQLVERRRALIERIARLDIVAPVAGIVLGLQVTTPRAVLRPADPVCFIIPQDRPLVIAAQVTPIHIDEVRTGQPVVLTFPAFSSRTTPQLNGTVTTVSADALVDPRTQASYYRAEITLNPGEIGRLGAVSLVPGMPVEAFIQTEPRTPMAYFVKPFTDYFNRAFRES